MVKVSLTLFIAIFNLCVILSWSSRIRISKNGYEDILIALPVNVPVEDRTKIVVSLQKLLQRSSATLSVSTKGRAYFRSATFLVPKSWGYIDFWLPDRSNDTTFEEAGAALNRVDSDVVVNYSDQNDHPYTLHQGGCGRRALRIYLSSAYLLSGIQEPNGAKFVRLWSEFRYGIFLEGGFEEDEKFPAQYQISGDIRNKTTGCSSGLFRDYCSGDGQCEKEEIMSSMMNQHLPNSAINFCEGHLSLGPRHDNTSPSKHNLLCNEEGTWFTVLRSPDFKNGKNSAPKHLPDVQTTFRFVQEVSSPRVIVAIDVSSQMKKENRYALTKNAFSHFVDTILPDGSELTLLLFGGSGNSSVALSTAILEDDESRTNYLEGQPFPEQPTDDEDACLECALEDIIELIVSGNSTFASAPDIILITTQQKLNETLHKEYQRIIQRHEIQLRAMVFPENNCKDPESCLYQLCQNTGNHFVSLEGDILRNLYKSFADSVTGPKAKMVISQKYLMEVDEEVLRFSFVVDPSVSQTLQVSISGPLFDTAPLLYDSTRLIEPSGVTKPLKKTELVPSWNFYLTNPEAGEYTLRTWRKAYARSPILVNVYGTSREDEDPIIARVWVEVLESKVSPPPVQIFAEVKQGSYPLRNATVMAYVHFPGGDDVSEIQLVDDGLGSVDITKDDGLYSHYFTNFTTIGFYNVYATVSGGFDDYCTILKGPTSDCCGSFFTWNEQSACSPFQREAGPVTFQVTEVSGSDMYPPAKVTDLRIIKRYDPIVIFQWSAVGDNFDTGVADVYKLKMFRDRALIRSRFHDSNVTLLSERIETTSLAEYPRTLYHRIEIPDSLEGGIYYFAIRALDKAENEGEPSNAVPFRVSKEQKATHIDCLDLPIADRLNSATYTSPFTYVTLLIVLHLLI